MTAKIKLNAASGGGSFSLQAPSSSSNNRVMTLPDTLQMERYGNCTMGYPKVDSWRISSSLSNNGDNYITANWERQDNYL